MQTLDKLSNYFHESKNALLILPFSLWAVEVFWWLAWGASSVRGAKWSSPLICTTTRILFSISSLVLVSALSAVLMRYQRWLRRSRYAERYFEPTKSTILIVFGAGLALLFMLIAAWNAPVWSMIFQITIWLLLCSATFELSPDRIAPLLDKATHYPRRGIKELAVLAYARRFGCGVIGLLCIEVGAWLLYLLTRKSVVNYAEAVAAFFVVTLAMYLLLYIPSCWGGIFLQNDTKRQA